MIRFRAFRAINELDTCQRFFDDHINVLTLYGVTKVTSANSDWFYNPGSYVVIAELSTGELVGGIRVHLVGGSQPLPIEEAIGEMDPKIYLLVEEYGKKGAGELCGLWNSRKVAGMGISVLLTRAGVAIATQINANTIFGICADFTLPMFKSVGYKVEESLGDHGKFYYPKEDFNANALIMDAVSLKGASEYDKNLIFALRENTKQTRLEQGPKGPLEIAYNLEISNTQL
jgi:hypothetical protein